MKLSDINNSICIDYSVENKNCILLKKVTAMRAIWGCFKLDFGGDINRAY